MPWDLLLHGSCSGQTDLRCPAQPQSEGTLGPLLPSLPVTLVEELQCTGQVKTLRKLQGKRLDQLQPLPQTLRAWALLQLDGTPRVCRAASARLASAAKNKSFREKVRQEEGRWRPPGRRCARRAALPLSEQHKGVRTGGCIPCRIFRFREAPNVGTALLTPLPWVTPALGRGLGPARVARPSPEEPA